MTVVLKSSNRKSMGQFWTKIPHLLMLIFAWFLCGVNARGFLMTGDNELTSTPNMPDEPAHKDPPGDSNAAEFHGIPLIVIGCVGIFLMLLVGLGIIGLSHFIRNRRMPDIKPMNNTARSYDTTIVRNKNTTETILDTNLRAAGSHASCVCNSLPETPNVTCDVIPTLSVEVKVESESDDNSLDEMVNELSPLYYNDIPKHDCNSSNKANQSKFVVSTATSQHGFTNNIISDAEPDVTQSNDVCTSGPYEHIATHKKSSNRSVCSSNSDTSKHTSQYQALSRDTQNTYTSVHKTGSKSKTPGAKTVRFSESSVTEGSHKTEIQSPEDEVFQPSSDYYRDFMFRQPEIDLYDNNMQKYAK